ncbi:hypothetical protein HN51_009445 [Arachis hypogaea]
MRVHHHKSSSLIIMFLLFILVMIHLNLSSWRHISWGGKEQRTTTTRFFTSFPNFHSAQQVVKDKKVSKLHTVTHATTPGGPNPLHN